MPNKSDDMNSGYLDFLENHSDGKFSDYYAEMKLKQLNDGKIISSLGDKTINKRGEISEFGVDGDKIFDKYINTLSLDCNCKLIDYGCGSLRVGSHFINYLNSRCYCGMDISNEFIRIGARNIGDNVLKQKKPMLASITPDAVERGIAFAADVVISHLVHYHVHPDEQAEYFGNLSKLAWRPGARLAFTTKISDMPKQTSYVGWAWPLQHFVESLPGFELQFQKLSSRSSSNGVSSAMLIFERNGAT